jgi:PAS domain-containing protein
MVGLMQFMTKIEWQLSMVGKCTTITKKVSEYRFIRLTVIAWVMDKPFLKKFRKSDCGYVGTVTDITERKQAEDNFKEKLLSETIINNLPGIFYLYDESGKF